MPCLALLQTRRPFLLQAVASRRGKGSAGLSLLVTSVCGGENSMLNSQEEESTRWLESVEGRGSSAPWTRMDSDSGHGCSEANCNWQLFSFHPMVKTATLKRTSLCNMRNHKIRFLVPRMQAYV